MKRWGAVSLVALLLIGLLTGCAERNDPAELDYSGAYDQLAAYKTEGYQQLSVAEFNSALKSWYASDGDSFRAAYNTAAYDNALLPDDENYEFIKLTLTAALAELDAEGRGDDDIWIFENRLEHQLVSEDWHEIATTMAPDYEFRFCADYWILYTVPDPSALTVEERDDALKMFRAELQGYINSLSKEELADEHIRTRLSEKAAELAERISTERMTLSCSDIRDINVIYQYPR